MALANAEWDKEKVSTRVSMALAGFLFIFLLFWHAALTFAGVTTGSG